jgi:hypothetical protein
MPTANYWVVMFDRDGGEKDPEGPFDSWSEARSHGEFDLDGCRWVTYEIQEDDDNA